MIERGIRGSIINNIASMSGSIVNIPQWQCIYNSSKAGLIHLTKSQAIEWMDHGIRVNSIGPGYIAVPMSTVLGMKSTNEVLDNYLGVM